MTFVAVNATVSHQTNEGFLAEQPVSL
jgi:hypothetical protein